MMIGVQTNSSKTHFYDDIDIVRSINSAAIIVNTSRILILSERLLIIDDL